MLKSSVLVLETQKGPHRTHYTARPMIYKNILYCNKDQHRVPSINHHDFCSKRNYLRHTRMQYLCSNLLMRSLGLLVVLLRELTQLYTCPDYTKKLHHRCWYTAVTIRVSVVGLDNTVVILKGSPRIIVDSFFF